MKISIEHYIATNNPLAVELLLKKRGIAASKNLPDAIQKLRFVMAKEGDNVIKELSNIDTPYQNLILSTQEKTSSACGCSGADGDSEESSSCAGNPACKCNGDSNFRGGASVQGKVSSGVDGQPQTQQPIIPVVTEPKKEDVMSKAMPLIAIGLLLVVTTAVLMRK